MLFVLIIIRQERRRTDKFAVIRIIWKKWVEILPKLFNPSYNHTVDKQLVAFRGRCDQNLDFM